MIRWAYRGIHLFISFLIAVTVMWVSGFGVISFPPLGETLSPTTGVWSLSKTTEIKTETLDGIPSLKDDVIVTFDTKGVPSIQAKHDEDLFFTIGYVHASNRLFQMDLSRRQGKGQLAEILGEFALSNDIFELQLGIRRIAEKMWDNLNDDDPAKSALITYTNGVNEYIKRIQPSGEFPLMFKILGYKPDLWEPVDSLVIQGIMTQKLSFSTKPLDYALLVESMGYDRTMEWFPLYAANAQFPFDKGPYEPGEQGGAARSNELTDLDSRAQVEDFTAKALV